MKIGRGDDPLRLRRIATADGILYIPGAHPVTVINVEGDALHARLSPRRGAATAGRTHCTVTRVPVTVPTMTNATGAPVTSLIGDLVPSLTYCVRLKVPW